MEPNESRAQTDTPKENLVESEITPRPSAIKDLPTVIIDPSLKVEAEQAGEKKRGRRRSKRPRAQLSQAKTEKNTRASENLSAADADRYASSIRPSWDPGPPLKSASESRRVAYDAAEQTTDKKDISSDLSGAASLGVPYHRVSFQSFIWAGGSVAAVALLIGLVIFSSNSSSTALIKNGNSRKEASTEIAEASKRPAPPKELVALNHPPPTAPKQTPPPQAAAPIASAKPSPSDPTPLPESKTTAASITTVTPAQQAPMAEPVQEAPKVATVAPVVEPKVRVRVETSPKNAQLFLDGAAVANPFDIRVPTSGKHQFEARSDGFRPTSRTVDFDRDHLIYLNLTKAPSQTLAKAPATVVSHRSATQSARQKATASVKRPIKVKTVTRTPSKTLGAGFVSTNPY